MKEKKIDILPVQFPVHLVVGDQSRIRIIHRHKCAVRVKDLIHHTIDMGAGRKVPAHFQIFVDVHRRTQSPGFINIQSREYFLSLFYPVRLFFKRKKQVFCQPWRK